MAGQEKEQWHLDKRVPLALIVMIFIQSASAIWWAASVDSEMDVHQEQIQTLKEDLKESKARTDEAVNAVGELKIHLQYTNDTLTEIKNFLKHEVKWEKGNG